MSIFNGMKKGVPIAIAYIPYAMALGFLAKNVGVPTHIIFLMSVIIYAGSSELIILTLYPAVSGIYDLIIPAIVVNIRYLLINLPVIKNQKNEDKKMKIFSSLLLTDEAVAYLTARKIYNANETFGFGFIAYLAFCISTLMGAILGNIIPKDYSIALNFVLYAIFLSLIIEVVKSNFRYLYVILLTLFIKISLEYLGVPKTFTILCAIILGALIPAIIKVKREDK